MGYIFELLVALMFSFGGTCVQLIRPFFSSSMITFLRFSVGVAWLLLLKAVRRQRMRKDFLSNASLHWPFLLLGAVSKWFAYLLENAALSIGVSYGNILTQPAQMVILTLLGAFLLREMLTKKQVIGVVLCVLGILLISWNGLSLQEMMQGSLLLSLMYVLSGMCAGVFIFAQKKAAPYFDILDSNLCMFTLSALFSLPVAFFSGGFLPVAPPDVKCILAICYFGFVTGIGFYLNALAMTMVPMHMVAILQSTMVFFALLWGVLFFHESVSIWIMMGTVMFVLGIILGRNQKAQQKAAPSRA